MTIRTAAFSTFPEFSRLTLVDRERYESYVKALPPVSDISFVTMMQWWNTLGNAYVSRLYDNLVISYWIDGYESQSGLSLIGTNRVDESICTIFDYLRDNGQPVRLVKVPEIVVHNIQYPELFNFHSGRRDDEYIISVAQFSKIENFPMYKRAKIKRFMQEFGRTNIEVKNLDMCLKSNQRLLLKAADAWPRRGINAIGKLEREVLDRSVALAAALDTSNLCLFIDGQLQAYCLYYVPSSDQRYINIEHARLNYDITGLFDYMTYAFSRWFADNGFDFANIHADLDVARLRIIKLAMRPVNFFRKYTIEPA